MVKSIMLIVLMLVGFTLGIGLTYVFFRLIYIAFTTRIKRKATLKRRIKHFKYHFLYSSFFNSFDFVKWVLFDIFRGKDRFNMYGIWAFTGYFGQGKTLGAVTLAKMYQKKYPEKHIKIFTNFNMVGQDGRINSWEDIVNLPRCSILIFDEIQSTFTSQKFKDFPIDLLWKLTQCRKSQLMVFCSSPVFHRMAIQLRENVDYVVECKNVLKQDRYFVYHFYKAPEYERFADSPLRLMASREFTNKFIATDKHYKAYDTHQVVDRIDITGQQDKRAAKKNVTNIDRNQILKEVETMIKSATKK